MTTANGRQKKAAPRGQSSACPRAAVWPVRNDSQRRCDVTFVLYRLESLMMHWRSIVSQKYYSKVRLVVRTLTLLSWGCVPILEDSWLQPLLLSTMISWPIPRDWLLFIENKIVLCVVTAAQTSMPLLTAQLAFKNSMIHRRVQFTLRIAACCALHRPASQDIHCQKLCL
jgi:hypothetical protein